jgi:hypothetical protein
VLAAAVAAMAMAAVTAASASATIVSAKFSTSSEFYIKAASVTIKKKGESPKSCSLVNPVRAAEFGAGSFIGSNESFFDAVKFTCSGSAPLKVSFNGQMKYDTETGRYWLQVHDGPSNTLESPWGAYWQKTGETDQWTWVNGSGSTPSTMTLSEQWVGYLASTGENITISGTLTATTLAGGLITLTH